MEKKYKGPIPKQYFPSLLKKTLDSLETLSKNIIRGFAGTGLIPLDRDQVLKRLPKPITEDHNPNDWTASVIDLLNESRNACKPSVTKKKKVTVEPGKSISKEDLSAAQTSSTSQSSSQDVNRKDLYTLDDFEELNVPEETNLPSSDEDEVDVENLKKDDFIEIQYCTDKDKYFIGLVQEINELVTVKFLRPNRKKENCFLFPFVDDISDVNKEQIKKVLPKPTILRRGGYEFPKKSSQRAYLNY